MISEEQALLGGAKTAGAAWSSGKGLIGLIGGLFQEGGVINQPTIGLLGEAGPEAVVPLKGGKIPVEGGGGHVFNYEQNTFQVFSDDPNSWEQRHASQVIKLIQTNVRRGGQMKDIIRGM